MSDSTGGADGDTPVCSHCTLPISEYAGDAGGEGSEVFCSEACAEADSMDEACLSDPYESSLLFETGVGALDTALPRGMPRNSFTLLSCESGTRVEALQAELAWRRLEQGEHVIIVALAEPPLALIQHFLMLGWNPLPHLEAGRIHILDCFTPSTTSESLPSPDSALPAWNEHLDEAVENAVTEVYDPSTRNIAKKLREVVTGLELRESGLILIDSLSELEMVLGSVTSYSLIKHVRSCLCKSRHIPVVAGASFSGSYKEFPHDLEHLVDGVIDLQLNPNRVSSMLVKEVGVRKMSSVVSFREYLPYEYAQNHGMVVLPLDDLSSVVDEDTGAAALQGFLPDDVTGAENSGGPDGED